MMRGYRHIHLPVNCGHELTFVTPFDLSRCLYLLIIEILASNDWNWKDP